MKAIKNKIVKVIRESNGFPNYTIQEYTRAIRHILNEELSNDELEFIERKNIDIDKWIVAITKEITEDLF